MTGSLASDGAGFYIALGAAWLRDSRLAPGAAVEVELSPEGPQAALVALDITAALEPEPQARAFFESLATYYRKNYIRWIEDAKRPETRAARINEMLELC